MVIYDGNEKVVQLHCGIIILLHIVPKMLYENIFHIIYVFLDYYDSVGDLNH